MPKAFLWNWLYLMLKLNRLSPLLHYLSATSSLLQLSPPPLSRVILTRTMVLQLIITIATSLVPYKSLCRSLASFTPDIMPTVIRSSLALLTGTNVTACFQHLLFNITRRTVAGSLYSTLQLLSTGIVVPVFPYRSPPREFPLSAA